MGWVTGYLGRVRLTHKKSGLVTGQPVFTSSKKNQVRVRYFSGRDGSEFSDLYCHV